MIVQRKRSDLQKFLERKTGTTPEVVLWADFLNDTIPQNYFDDKDLNWNVFARRIWGFLEDGHSYLFSSTLHAIQLRNDFNIEDFIEVTCWMLSDFDAVCDKIPVAAYMYHLMLKEPRLVEDFKSLSVGHNISNELTIVNLKGWVNIG